MQAALAQNIRALRIAEGRDIFQEHRFFRKIGYDIQKIKAGCQAQADPIAISPPKGRYTEADRADFQRQQKVGQMQK